MFLCGFVWNVEYDFAIKAFGATKRGVYIVWFICGVDDGDVVMILC